MNCNIRHETECVFRTKYILWLYPFHNTMEAVKRFLFHTKLLH